jgi:polar amino acid transport system substrate-binding protein
MRKLLVFVVALFALAALAAACGGEDEEASPGTTEGTTAAAQPDPCAKDQLQLVNPGQLTIATDNPAFPPWFQDAEGAPWDPTTEPTKMGYEAAVSYALAQEMGFSDAEVQWVVVPFDNAFRPGPKDFDFDINQVSYLPERDEAVDFSDSYYDVQQAVVTLKNSDYANASALADLEGAKLGAPVGTTSLQVIESSIQPGE